MKEVMTYLANLDVGTVLKLNVGSFGPSVSHVPHQRLAGLGSGSPSTASVAQSEFREAIFSMMVGLRQHKVDVLKIEPMRHGPVGLRQSLWDDLRKLAPTSNQTCSVQFCAMLASVWPSVFFPNLVCLVAGDVCPKCDPWPPAFALFVGQWPIGPCFLPTVALFCLPIA